MSKHSQHRQSTPDLPRVDPGHISPLVLCDHLIQVAKEADRAGYVQTAAHLVELVDRLFDSPPNFH